MLIGLIVCDASSVVFVYRRHHDESTVNFSEQSSSSNEKFRSSARSLIALYNPKSSSSSVFSSRLSPLSYVDGRKCIYLSVFLSVYLINISRMGEK